MRKNKIVENEYYHVYNRGVDKRDIFVDENDLKRFLKSMDEFNTVEPIGSIYENRRRGHLMSTPPPQKLVDFICYCLNQNHYHFLLIQLVDKGIEKFMQRLGNGYTKYFNNKYKRNGSLFQGTYKSVLIESNEQLLHTNVYINLNNRGHLMSKMSGISKSSWEEYCGNSLEKFCNKKIIFDQFATIQHYIDFAMQSHEITLASKNISTHVDI